MLYSLGHFTNPTYHWACSHLLESDESLPLPNPALQRSQHPRKTNTSHRMLLVSFCNHLSRRQLAPVLDKPAVSRFTQTFQPQFVVPNFGSKTGASCRRLNHLAKLLQKFIASQKNKHITSHVAIIFCHHPANFLQKDSIL